jgi:ferric-dicitrate binding protein FerR (iron transport regulator)
MSNDEPTGGRTGDSPSEQALREQLQHAGARPAPPAADEAEIRAAVFAEWDAVTGRRVRLRRGAAAVAASALVVSVVLLVTDTQPSGPIVANAERVSGDVAVAGGDESGALEMGEPLYAGAVLTTNDGAAALRLAAGGSLRLAPETRLVLAASGEVQLLAGKLYFDSAGERGDAAAFAVVTEAGVLRDVGTQFMVTHDGERIEVGVRDGRVAWQPDARAPAAEASAGERLAVAGDRGIERGTIATFGPDWAWAERLAPPFSLDGRKLHEVLEWTAEQTGRRIAYADEAAERAAADTTLTGSTDLPPLAQLAAAMALTDLAHRIEGDSIVVSLK